MTALSKFQDEIPRAAADVEKVIERPQVEERPGKLMDIVPDLGIARFNASHEPKAFTVGELLRMCFHFAWFLPLRPGQRQLPDIRASRYTC
jgi:hypothetical protein